MYNVQFPLTTHTHHPTTITQQDNCIGTYIHGFLDNPSVIEFILKGKAENIDQPIQNKTYEEFKDRQYDLLAEHVRKYVDIKKLYEIISRP